MILTNLDGSENPPEARINWLCSLYLAPVAEAYLNARLLDATEARAFEIAVGPLIQWLFDYESVEIVWRISFQNLYLECDDLVLEPGVRLRKATESELKAEIESSWRSAMALDSRTGLTVFHALAPGFRGIQPSSTYLDVTEPKTATRFGIEFSRAHSVLARLRTALHITGPEYVSPLFKKPNLSQPI